METKPNTLWWGFDFEEGNLVPQAIRFSIEEKHWAFRTRECPIFKSVKSLYPSVMLKQAFKDNDFALASDTRIAPVLGTEDVYVVGKEGVEKQSQQKPNYVMCKENGNIDVFTVEYHTVSTNDILAILTIHKCCEDYIRITTQKEKDITKKPLDEILSTLSSAITNLHLQLQTAKEKGQRYEEVVLDICTDEFLLTCDQSLKVLALLLASIQKLVDEECEYKENRDVPYHQ